METNYTSTSSLMHVCFVSVALSFVIAGTLVTLVTCVCFTLPGLSALRSSTYHGSQSVRPGIAFRGHVYQPTEMALVMNGGTVSLEDTHSFTK